MRRPGTAVLIAALLVAACGNKSAAAPPAAPSTLTVTSTAFTEGGTIPAADTCKGAGTRPALSWTGSGTPAAWAIVVFDPDAGHGGFYHWVVVDLPAGTHSVGATVPSGAVELDNSAGKAGWTPPCPPSGTHHYQFTVYGLSKPTGLTSSTSPKAALTAIQDAATEQGRLTGLVTHS